MANMEHVQLVRRGRDVVARWREANPNELLDLNAAYMSYVRAPQVNISGAELRHADLMGAVLRRANLSGCFLNPCHLYHADLREADLTNALFNGSNMRGADLRGANLTGADLDRAILSDANLSGANLTNANLQRTSLIGANLAGANLSGANFAGASLVRSDLTDATLNAKFGSNSAPNNGGMTGTINNFRLNDGSENPGWSVTLNRSSAWGSNGAITGPTSDATVWSINDNKASASGAWSGTMYDELPGNAPAGDGSDVPTTVTGTFYSEFSTIGRMVGGFVAEKQ